MARLSKRAAIIDRRALGARLARIPRGEGEAPEDHRRRVLGPIKDALEIGQAEVRRRFEAGASAAVVLAANTYLIDEIIHALYGLAARRLYPVAKGARADSIGVVAVGGYGRAELAPYSDVDILFLLSDKRSARDEQIIDFVLYALWDLGLPVGHAVRSLDECIRRATADMTIRTGLLEARRVCGDDGLFATLKRRFAAEVVDGSESEFVAAKLAERDARHRRTGDSRYLLEPNIKEGKGGLRDLHTLFWIAKYLYRVERFGDLVERDVLTAAEHARFVKAERFLWRLRCHLHYMAGRPEERLTFDVQPEMARRMGYADRLATLGVERFMKHYFLVAKDVGDLTRIFCATLEAEHLQAPPGADVSPAIFGRDADGFAIEGGRLTVADEDAFAARPARLIKLFHLAQANGLDIHPRALRLIRQNFGLINRDLRTDPEANRLFVEILTSRKDPEVALRRMNEAGVLGKFIPDFGRVVAQMQHDMYHVYTVDEHAIRAIGMLTRIERGELGDDLPLATEIIGAILSRRALYLALFLHDVAKGHGGDHPRIGARIAGKLGPRLGFAPEETETVVWLVRNHLRFSDTAFKRDVNDPKTVVDFVAEVQSLERLRLLLVLTAADIRAVGPGRWNGWKGALLRELFHRAEEIISGGHEADQQRKTARVAAAKQELRRRLAGWSGQDFIDYAERLPTPYWLTFDAETQQRHAEFVRDADDRRAAVALAHRIDRFRSVTEITLYAPDHPGLFAEAAGAMAMAGASIVDAKIFTTFDGCALDSFWVQDATGAAFDRPERIARLGRLVEEALGGEIELEAGLANRRSLPKRADVFRVEPRVLIDNMASGVHTVIEINGRDRPGLLYSLTRTLTGLGLTIVTAHVMTFGARAVDVFYVKDRYGLKITREAQLTVIRRCLIEALTEPGAARSGPALAGSAAGD